MSDKISLFCDSRCGVRRLFVGLVLTTTLGGAKAAFAVGLDPVPNLFLNDTHIQAQVQRELVACPFRIFEQYTYTYSITNPGPTGEIWYFKVDITQRSETFDNPCDDTLPRSATPVTFGEHLDIMRPLLLPPGISVVPVGQKAPPGWVGGFGRDGLLGFASGTGTPNILEGETLGGFEVVTRRLPTLRRVLVFPDWVLVVEDHDAVTETELDQAEDIQQAIRFSTFTLGPSPVFRSVRFAGRFAFFGIWNRLRDDLDKMIDIGWITDANLGNTLVSQLADARAALDQSDQNQSDLALARTRLQTLLDTLNQASNTQLRLEARQLIQLNAESLIQRTTTPIRVEPVVSLTPRRTELSIGSPYTLTVKAVNAADNDSPIPNFLPGDGESFSAEVVDGPHAGESTALVTDANGEATFSYTGTKVGIDRIELLTDVEGVDEVLDEVEVRWAGGPDLGVPLFIPPILSTETGNITILVNEITANVGNLASPPSVTRYFFSDVEPVDPATAIVVGERPVPTLQPDELNSVQDLTFQVPGGLPPGIYFMAACADPDGLIVELDEDNNCSFNQLENFVSVVIPGVVPDNNPPDCSQAAASPDSLWPPNHKLVGIDITGITDPDGDPVTLTITSIQQDEPVNGVADGDKSPDGFGVGTAQAQVRQERAGNSNGRIYEIGFSAEDDQGASCTGNVLVGVVPHDQGQGSTPIDDGVRFDSTQP